MATLTLRCDKALDSLRKPQSIAENELRKTNQKFRQILYKYDSLLEQSLTPNQLESLNQKRSQTTRKRANEIADFLRQFAIFLDAVSTSTNVEVFEGLPRAKPEELAEIKGDHQTIEFDGWSFYAAHLRPNQSQIEKLRSTFTDYQEFSHHPKNMGKGCGGFHPDFYLRWKTDGQLNHVMICLGCNELKFLSASTKTILILMTRHGNLLHSLRLQHFDFTKTLSQRRMNHA